MYRSTIAALQYLTITRLDITFSVNKLSQFLRAPIVAHWSACERILRYIRGTLSYGLLFKPTKVTSLEGYANADGASNLDDRKYVSGVCIFLGGNLICWSSRKQKVVACSSTEAEYRALSTAATYVVWIQNLLTEIEVHLQSKPPILACNPVYHARTNLKCCMFQQQSNLQISLLSHCPWIDSKISAPSLP